MLGKEDKEKTRTQSM